MSKTGSTFLNTLTKDQNKEAIQVGNSFSTTDASASPKTSPLAFSSSVITIAVPDNAVEFIANPSTAMRISELSSMAQYDVIAANTKEAVCCARMSNIYIKRDASDGTLNFRWTLI